MTTNLRKLFPIFCLTAMCSILIPAKAYAAESTQNTIESETSTSMNARIDGPNVVLYESPSSSSATIDKAVQGKTYPVTEVGSNGWVKIATDGGEGYIKVARNATLVEQTSHSVDQSVVKRREIVEYALQFVGNRYVYGGSDPNKGVDCSGFTRYILQNTAGVSLPHSSTGQSGYGNKISQEQLRPGDLLFYGGTGYIDHVALYIGNGQIVHASSARTGIKISSYNYRNPVKMVNVLND